MYYQHGPSGGAIGYGGRYSLGVENLNASSPGRFAIAHLNDNADALYNFKWFFDGNTGDFTSPGNVTAYSDARLKTNVQTITDALHTVTQLRGVTFDKNDRAGLGVIAQEVREILPELVAEGMDENKTLSVAYGNMVGLLIEAIKELKAEVDELRRAMNKE
jgi:hypothetical protein